MQLTTTPMLSVLPNPDDLTDIAELRAALKKAYELMEMMAASTHQEKGAIEYLLDVIAPILKAHHCGDHGEVKRLMDAYIESGVVKIVPDEKSAVH